jgi:hypothetical protein
MADLELREAVCACTTPSRSSSPRTPR